MADDPQPMTLQQRIASLNAAHVGRAPTHPPPSIRPQLQVPEHRPPLVKHNSVNIPHEQINGTIADTRVGNQPNGPPQLPARKQPPPLPNRNGALQPNRSTSHTASVSPPVGDPIPARTTDPKPRTESNGRIKAPAWGESELPPLPPKATQPSRPLSQTATRPKHTSRVSSYGQNIQAIRKTSVPSIKPTLPPPLPGRKSEGTIQEQPDEAPVRKLAPMPILDGIEQAKRVAFGNVLQSKNDSQQDPSFSSTNLPFRPQLPTKRPVSAEQPVVSGPPPIPLASRPDLAAIQATKPKYVPPSNNSQPPPYSNPNECMTCRDFSGPDSHAARFPRQQVTSLPDLAYQLTVPFQSLTDKARAIFTWLHHNIAYDVVSFFNDKVQGSTPQSTLQTGLAVCEGYAALFTNLANHAGLESVVISGHGKGYGYTALEPGEPIPPYKMGHAWNVVKIDHGEWKLLDACWGAGHVQGKGMPYVAHFNPVMFTMSNEEFGIKHFPSNKNQFFLSGGRTMSWEEYIQINPDRWPYDCEQPTLYCNAKEDHSIGQRTVTPRERKIRVNAAGTVRFSFGLFCEHWTLSRHTKKGLPPVFILAVHGVDGRKDDFMPLEHVKGNGPDGGGDVWYLDIPARELGAPGQTITIFAITTFGDRKNVRGMTVREFLQGKGKVGMAFSGVAAWDLV